MPPQLPNSITENAEFSSADRREQFVCIPLSILEADLSGGALKALIGLLSFRNRKTGQCNPSLATLSNRLKTPPGTVRHWMRELRRKGVITAVAKPGFVNSYQVNAGLSKSERQPCPDPGGHPVQNQSFSPGASLYEPDVFNQREGTERAGARIPPQRSASSTRQPSIVEQTLAAYYENQRRKAAKA